MVLYNKNFSNKRTLIIILLILIVFLLLNSVFNYQEGAISKKVNSDANSCVGGKQTVYTQMQNNKDCNDIQTKLDKYDDVNVKYCSISGSGGTKCSDEIIKETKTKSNIKATNNLPKNTTGICTIITGSGAFSKFTDSKCFDKNGSLLSTIKDKDKYDNKSLLGTNYYIKRK